MKTHDRYAIRSELGWVLPKRHYGNVWTPRSEFARLYIRRADADREADRLGGVVHPVSVGSE